MMSLISVPYRTQRACVSRYPYPSYVPSRRAPVTSRATRPTAVTRISAPPHRRRHLSSQAHLPLPLTYFTSFSRTRLWLIYKILTRYGGQSAAEKREDRPRAILVIRAAPVIRRMLVEPETILTKSFLRLQTGRPRSARTEARYESCGRVLL